MPTVTNPSSPLDRNERDLLFSVLLMYGDTSYVSAAQAQLLRADGEVDRGALKYLQQSLGPQAVPLAAQCYDDPRLTDPAKKEPFARLALNYVGADAQANEFYQKAINDLALSASHRKNLIEDLNQDGFPDTKNLTARDLPLIQNRLSLIEQLAPHAPDSVNAAAFKEAYKDLLKMRDRVTRRRRHSQWSAAFVKLINGWKGKSSREANKLLGRRGQFWQADYYDTIVRDTEHLRKPSVTQNKIQ